MDSSNPTAPAQRDLVYCHQCENEWYRDEHGLLPCPECGGDFTELVEPDHDPREDHMLSDMPEPQHDHGEFYGAPDPDEEDIGNLGDLQWTRNEQGGMTGRGTITRTITIGGQQGQQQGQGGILGAIGSMIQGMIAPQQPGQNQQAQQEQRPGEERPASAPPRDGANVRHIHGPWGSMTIATSSSGNLYPRNANGPQPIQAQPDHIEQIMQQMLANIMGPMHGGQGGPPMFVPGMGPGVGMGGMPPQFMAGGGARGPMPMFPADIFQLLGGMAPGGVHGDAVYSQEALDRIITQLMEQHQTGTAPGPASDAAIKALPTKTIDVKDLGDNGKAECSICMDEVEVGTEVTVLPCTHWFHAECIKAWLSEHDTCPHCRQGIMPKEGGAEHHRPREPSQAPLHDMNSPESTRPSQMPGTFSRQPSGSRENPFAVPESPTSGRRSSSTPGRQGSASGNVFSRMRDAFGNGGGSSGSGGAS